MMRRLLAILLIPLSLSVFAQDLPRDEPPKRRIVLAGDSTVTDAAGWGAGFADSLRPTVECLNLAQGGRSSRSYRAEGWWQKCLSAKPDYLLIQFGHNDQPGKGPDRESAADGDFRDHLRGYIEEAQAAGIQPILVTSLERRIWSLDGTIAPSLQAYAEATRAVAEQTGVPLIDLHALSIDVYEKLGATAVRAFEPMSKTGADHTHLNAEGSRVFGQLVARELARQVPELAANLLATTSTTLAASHAAQQASPGDMSVTESEATITVASKGVPIVVYNKQSPPVPAGIDPIYQRSGFLHPVATPLGKVVTATFPIDHAHQHGIFSAWVKTTYDNRQIDFWNLAGGTGRVLHQRVLSTFNRPTESGFEVALIHQTVIQPVVDVLVENWTVQVYPTDGSFRCFDIDSTQRALTDVPLIVQEYHYGGMAIRGPVRWVQGEKQIITPENPPNLREPSNFLNDQGSDRVQGNHQVARWVAMHGTLDGHNVSITVLSHADNFRAPQPARLHPTKPYFCFAPCVAGEFIIDKQHPLRSRYRFLVTDAAPDATWIDQQWQAWCGKPSN
jgi:lysophospholipase L1-like esterase